MSNLYKLELGGNQITDISPLLALNNLSQCYLRGNPLNEKSVKVYIPELRKGGVFIDYLSVNFP